MSILLAGDIGGTKTILRVVDQPESGGEGVRLAQKSYRSGEFEDLVPMVERFFQEAGQDRGTVQKACLAIAGPVADNQAELTNLTWHLDGDRLATSLHLDRVMLINDFVAVGYGILGLQPEDLHTLQMGKFQPDAPIAIIGAGTGLGQGFLIPLGKGQYQMFPSEGGHADFAPRTTIEFALRQYLLEQYGWERVSVERVVSGLGIAEIYRFFRDVQGMASAPELQEVESSQGDLAAMISQMAQTGGDRLTQETMHLFIDTYGAETGNLALKLLPYGGLYIAGGIATKNLPLMTDGRFLQAFTQKGRMSKLLQQIPLHIILNPEVGLMGAAICAAQL